MARSLRRKAAVEGFGEEEITKRQPLERHAYPSCRVPAAQPGERLTDAIPVDTFHGAALPVATATDDAPRSPRSGRWGRRLFAVATLGALVALGVSPPLRQRSMVYAHGAIAWSAHAVEAGRAMAAQPAVTHEITGQPVVVEQPPAAQLAAPSAPATVARPPATGVAVETATPPAAKAKDSTTPKDSTAPVARHAPKPIAKPVARRPTPTRMPTPL